MYYDEFASDNQNYLRYRHGKPAPVETQWRYASGSAINTAHYNGSVRTQHEGLSKVYKSSPSDAHLGPNWMFLPSTISQ